VLRPLADVTRLHLSVDLQPRDPGGLAAYASAVSTPGSAHYGRYLTVRDFAARFGAPPAAATTVAAALRARGLEVGAASPNGLVLPVTGTAAEVEHAFSLALSQVRLASGRLSYSNDTAPALAAGVARYVQGVIGLDDTAAERPQAPPMRRVPYVPRRSLDTGGPQPCATAQSTAQNGGGYTADEIAAAYQLSSPYGPSDLGAGQTIALFEEQPFDPNDIAAYQSCYGTSVQISKVDVDGGPGPPAGQDDTEAALDIEQVIGLAPRATILAYEGPNAATSSVDVLDAIVSEDRAKVVSSSWGGCEADAGQPIINAENTLLQEAATQGQTVLISSGDTGSATCYQANQLNHSLSVLDPASQPYSTGVGGTTMYTASNGGPVPDSTGAPPTEAVWNDGLAPMTNQASASGGGISSAWPMPSYQSGAPSSLGVVGPDSMSVPCGQSLCREVPDVSANADPHFGYVVYARGGWRIVGGTSASAPLWAAFIAIANSSVTCRGLTIGFANPFLYEIAGSSSYSSNFNDVAIASPTSGKAHNDALGDNHGLYPVGPGYDMTTGLGTPIGGPLAQSLCSLRSPVYTVTVTNPGTQMGIAGKPVTLQIHATDSGAAPLTYTATGLPPGLSVNSSAGTITGTPSHAGAYTVTISATDAYTNSGTARFGVKVVKQGRPTVSRASLTGVAKRRAQLAFTAAQGAYSPALRSVTISLPRGLSFSKSAGSLRNGISVRGPGAAKLAFTPSLSQGRLTIALRTPAARAGISIGRAAIGVTGALADKVRQRKLRTVRVGARLVDAARGSTTVSLRLRP
jgi:subtilase family serine protease